MLTRRVALMNPRGQQHLVRVGASACQDTSRLPQTPLRALLLPRASCMMPCLPSMASKTPPQWWRGSTWTRDQASSLMGNQVSLPSGLRARANEPNQGLALSSTRSHQHRAHCHCRARLGAARLVHTRSPENTSTGRASLRKYKYQRSRNASIPSHGLKAHTWLLLMPIRRTVPMGKLALEAVWSRS